MNQTAVKSNSRQQLQQEMTVQRSADQKSMHFPPVPSSLSPFDISQIPVSYGKGSPLQPKLRINQPGDRYEQEADRIADQIMRMPKPQVQRKCGAFEDDEIQMKPLQSIITPVVQRKCTKCEEEEEELQMKPISTNITPVVQRKCAKCEEEEEELQMKENGSGEREATSSLATEIRQTKGHGHPVESETAQFISSRLGRDLSHVRVHTGARAARMNQEINAHAFTVGKDIYFNQGQYAPHTSEGRRLLAHELVHTVQQEYKSSETKIQRDVYSGPTTSGAILEEINRKLDNNDLTRINELVTNYLLMSSSSEILSQGIGLVSKLIEKNQLVEARMVLESVSSAFMFAFAVNSELLNTSRNPIDELIQQASNAESQGNNDLAIDLLKNAFYITQILILYKTEELDDDVAEALNNLGPDAANARFFGILQVMLYYSFNQLYNQFRSIATFYIQKQRQAHFSGNSQQARNYQLLDSRLRSELSSESILFSGSTGRGMTIMSTIPTASNPNPTLIGQNSVSESIRPLPGTPRPDEIAQHPYYSSEIPTLLETIRNQELLVSDVFQFQEVVSAFPNHQINWSDQAERIKVWNALYDALVRVHGATAALPQLMTWIQRYLQSYTFHTEYDIRDFGRSYLDSEMPSDLIGRLARDCGVYAVTVAYEVYRVARHASLNISFRIYTSLDHVILVMIDTAENRHFVLSNDVISSPQNGITDPEIINSVGNSFAAIGQTRFGVAPVLHNDAGNSSIGNQQFRTQLWNNFKQIGHQWGLRDRQVTNPETAQPESLYDRHYRELRIFNQRAMQTLHRLQLIEGSLGSVSTNQERMNILQREFLPLATAVITDVWPLFMRLGECADIATTSSSLARRAREFVFNSGGSVHPLVQVALMLLRYQNSGGVLDANQVFFICSLQRIQLFNSQIQNSGLALPSCANSPLNYQQLCHDLMVN